MKPTEMIPVPIAVARCWAKTGVDYLCETCEYEALCEETMRRILELEVEE